MCSRIQLLWRSKKQTIAPCRSLSLRVNINNSFFALDGGINSQNVIGPLADSLRHQTVANKRFSLHL